jgi:hypothetical protein
MLLAVDTFLEKMRVALSGRTRWRLVGACALSLAVSIPISLVTSVHNVARTALEQFETVQVLEPHGRLEAQGYTAITLETADRGVGLQIQPPCSSGDKSCYFTVRVERSSVLVVGLTALVLFMMLLGTIGIALTLISDKPVLEGKQLVIVETIQKHGRTTIRREYRALKTSEKQLRIPVEIRDDEEVGFQIDKLKVRAASYLRAKLVPEFKKGSAQYVGAIEFAPHTSGPVDFDLEMTLSSPYFRTGRELRTAKSDPKADLTDCARFLMAAHWKSVQIRMQWPEGQHFAFDGHPWAEMQRTEASDAEQLTVASGWNPDRWTLDLKDVSPGQVFSIRWHLKDEEEESAANAAASSG